MIIIFLHMFPTTFYWNQTKHDIFIPVQFEKKFRPNYKLHPLSLVKVQFSPLSYVPFQLRISIPFPLNLR